MWGRPRQEPPAPTQNQITAQPLLFSPGRIQWLRYTLSLGSYPAQGGSMSLSTGTWRQRRQPRLDTPAERPAQPREPEDTRSLRPGTIPSSVKQVASKPSPSRDPLPSRPKAGIALTNSAPAWKTWLYNKPGCKWLRKPPPPHQ